MLSDEVRQQLAESGPADIVVGLPTYNNAATLGTVLQAIRDGHTKYFAQARAALVNSDAGSTDETPALLSSTDWEGPRILARHESPAGELVAVPYHRTPGRTRAQRTMLEIAQELQAKACVLIGADCRSVTPEWIDRLLRPVLEDGQDYVTPLYQRHRYDGTLSNGLICPLVRALYGKQIQQPLGGHTSLSARLLAHVGAEEDRAGDAARQGIDLWLTVTAVTDGFRVSEAWLGPSVVEPAPGAPDLATTVSQVIGPTFALLEGSVEAWMRVRGSEAVPAVGGPLPLGADPVEVNVGRMVRAFRLGLKDLLPLWEQVLEPDTLGEVLALGPLPDDAFHFPHELWARVVYDFALAYHFRSVYRDHLLRSLVPLYLGRTVAFIEETSSGGARETEIWLERSCRAFERQKSHLLDRWR